MDCGRRRMICGAWELVGRIYIIYRGVARMICGAGKIDCGRRRMICGAGGLFGRIYII